MQSLTRMGSGSKSYLREYSLFTGADYTSPEESVARFRARDAENVIVENGAVCKRPGWRCVGTLGGGPCSSAVTAAIRGCRYYLAAAYGTLYVWGGEREVPVTAPRAVATGLGSGAVLFTAEVDLPENQDGRPEGRQLCVLAVGNGKAVCFDAASRYDPILHDFVYADALDLENVAYAPVTSIGRSPDGSVSTALESVNALTRRRRNRFRADGTTKTFKLDADAVDGYFPVTAVYIGGGEVSPTFFIDAQNGSVTFPTAPTAAIGEEDNIEIAFAVPEEEATASGVKECRIVSSFTIGNNDTRILLTGNGEQPDREWMSAAGNATYFPDDSYSVIGTGGTEICGYVNIDSAQCIVTRSRAGMPTIFLRGYTTDADGNTVITVRQGLCAPAPVSHEAFFRLGDESLYLSEEGLVTVSQAETRGNVSAVRGRSYFADGRLLPLLNGGRAAVCVWKGKAYLFVGSVVFVFDKKLSASPDGTARGYECTLWNGLDSDGALPFTDGETLWFVLSDGRICRLNDDLTGTDVYTDMPQREDAGVAIGAFWTTAADDDGAAAHYKQLMRKGVNVLLGSGSATVSCLTEEGTAMSESVNAVTRGGYALSHALKRTPCRYRVMSMKVENNTVGSGFSLYSLSRRYTIRQYGRE